MTSTVEMDTAAVFPVEATDDRGARVVLARPPRRIVSLVPSQTELLADLGLDDEVVGVTRFCVRPSGWTDRKTIVGGTKQVNVDRIAALDPDLVLANREENTREMVEALETIAPTFVTHVATLDDALAMIRTVGRLTGRPARAAALAADVEKAFASRAAYPPLRAAYLIWREPYMTVGGDTFIHDMLAHAGLTNVFADQTRYPDITPDELAARRPDVVLLSSEPYPFGPAHVDELREAIPGTHVRLVDGEPFSWYGSRLLHAPAYFRTLRDGLRNDRSGH